MDVEVVVVLVVIGVVDVVLVVVAGVLVVVVVLGGAGFGFSVEAPPPVPEAMVSIHTASEALCHAITEFSPAEAKTSNPSFTQLPGCWAQIASLSIPSTQDERSP